MKNKKNEKGKIGEELASQFLKNLDHTILHRNFRKREGEIDIISKNGNTLFFIEIKNWKSFENFSPLNIFNETKKNRMRTVSEKYLNSNFHYQSYFVSFGLISIDEKQIIQFYPDLF